MVILWTHSGPLLDVLLAVPLLRQGARVTSVSEQGAGNGLRPAGT